MPHETKTCPIRENVETICRRTIDILRSEKASSEEDTALQDLVETCNKALSHVRRSPFYPEGRLESGYGVPAGRALEKLLEHYPHLRTHYND